MPQNLPASNFSHSNSDPPLAVDFFFPLKFPSEEQQVSTGMGGAGAAVWSLGTTYNKAQIWGRSEHMPTLMEPLNLFCWDGDLHTKPWESAVAKYTKSCEETVSKAGPA